MYRAQFFLLTLLYLTASNAWASEWFKNSAQQAKEAFEQKAFEKSADLFTDPYQRGVALYREGQYAKAAEAFATVTRPETQLKAQYNLGNAYFQQGDYQKAIDAYENVLATQPTNENAKHNLELAKKLLEQQQKQSDQAQDPSKNEENQDQQQSQNAQASATSTQDANPSDTSPSVDNAKPQTSKVKPQQTAAVPQQDQQTVSENSEAGEAAKSQPATAQQADSNTPATLPTEEDVMAEVLLNRLEENPQRLLKGQFYLDAQRSESQPPAKPW